MRYLKRFESVNNFDLVKSNIDDIILELDDNSNFNVSVETMWRNNPGDVITINIKSFKQMVYKWSDISDVVIRLIEYTKSIDGSKLMITTCGKDFFAIDNFDKFDYFYNLNPDYLFEYKVDNSFNITIILNTQLF